MICSLINTYLWSDMRLACPKHLKGFMYANEIAILVIELLPCLVNSQILVDFSSSAWTLLLEQGCAPRDF